jgi:hypothetical protein
MNTSEIARVLGRRGGRARAARLAAADKKRIASLGAQARIESLAAERRIVANFAYVAATRDLRGDQPAVRQVKSCRGPLPGIIERPER